MAFLFDREFTRKELMQRVGDISQIGGVKQYQITDGKAKGVTAYEINTKNGIVTVNQAEKIDHCATVRVYQNDKKDTTYIVVFASTSLNNN